MSRESADERQPLIQEGAREAGEGEERATAAISATGTDVATINLHRAASKVFEGGMKLTRKGVLSVFFAALVVYLLAAAVSRTLAWESGDEDESVATRLYMDPRLSSGVEGTGGLVPPMNGTKPTLTSTRDCTGDISLPVLAGADVVSYFSMEEGAKPVIATGEIRSTHDGYLYFFNSVNHREAFNSEPHRYIPAWGGFCSYGIAAESVWESTTLGPFADPSKWKILSDGRLHIFRSETPMGRFSESVSDYLQAGNDNWKAWFSDRGDPLNTACFCSETTCRDK